jgi:hypothetical protein
MKLRRVANESGTDVSYMFWCPGCQSMHPYRVVSATRPRWDFNGDMEKPTFTPSLLCNKDWPERRCHLFLTAGKLHYCGDCYHTLKGQVVDLPDIPQESGWAD